MDQPAANLGNVRREFRPKLTNLAAGMIIGLILAVGGIAFATFLARRPDRKPLTAGDRIAKLACLGVVGIAVPLGGIALLIGMRRLATHRVTVFDEGFSYYYVGSTDVCRWSDTAEIQEIFTKEEMKVLNIPGASIKNVDRGLVVLRSDGREFRFTVNSVDSIQTLAKYLEAAREKYEIPLAQDLSRGS